MAVESLFIQGLLNSLGLGAAGVGIAGANAAKNAAKNSEKDDSKFGVVDTSGLGNPDEGLHYNHDNIVENSIKKALGKPHYLSKNEKDELMILLAESGLSTPEINKIMETGEISHTQFAQIPTSLRGKLSRLTGLDLEYIASCGVGGDPDNDDDDEEEKEKKKKEIKDKLQKEQNKLKEKYRAGENEFQEKNAKKQSYKDQSNDASHFRTRDMTEAEMKDWESPSARETRLQGRDAHRANAQARAEKETQRLIEEGLQDYVK